MKKQSKTCIALIKTRNGKLLMAGDRKVSCDWGFSYQCPNPKIKKKENGMLVGASGDSGLCKLIVDIFEPPVIQYNDIDNYMYYDYQKALEKLLKQQIGYKDSHNLVKLPPETYCMVLIGIEGKAYTVEISNHSETGDNSDSTSIIIDDAPIPYAIGCGSTSAIPILFSSKTSTGVNTKEQLKLAMSIAAEISPGCGSEPFDFIQDD